MVLHTDADATPIKREERKQKKKRRILLFFSSSQQPMCRCWLHTVHTSAHNYSNVKENVLYKRERVDQLGVIKFAKYFVGDLWDFGNCIVFIFKSVIYSTALYGTLNGLDFIRIDELEGVLLISKQLQIWCVWSYNYINKSWMVFFGKIWGYFIWQLIRNNGVSKIYNK